MKIAITSDNHFDVNKLDPSQMMLEQAGYLKEQHIDIYLIIGDLFNDFTKTLNYVHDLQNLLNKTTTVYFIAGNHDMLNGVSYEELENLKDSAYLHNRFIDVPGTDWRIVGNNGWYDYSLASNMPEKTADDFLKWKRSFWIDAKIKQPMNDIERMDIVLQQTKEQFEKAKDKKVVYITHFVPNEHFIRFTDDNRFWNMANGVMGSKRLGNLIAEYQTEYVGFGHMHRHFKDFKSDGTLFFNTAVGYHLKRINEWTFGDFITEWKSRLKILDLK
ncbi:metallophosphoesterase [Pediococcus claussenii]|uniref:Phosphoesterase family protein n=1 Tax=Pediococcus claussenii (strain ATCC BAA-344 / DSM 14800 / JCM 18046 / KCTC 3811 / LMG 21948 / P06) TaxID=701521 RepID=G8PAP2_PEDCP|nr:metallophosphoesterase [Pediococcus claussenii]AEV94601.1 phosphoesterase family protein [Pediococcus claussenii ATCC BAA-344]ANZ69808.1 phosphoesterase [Pediococcus claussenii]ANZ71625.1 phosphoesterase [Pediococcus claussenii]